MMPNSILISDEKSMNPYPLGLGGIWLLLFYFMIVFIIGFYFGYKAILFEELMKECKFTKVGSYGSIGFALLGCSIYYFRRLYKVAIAGQTLKPKDEFERHRRVGVLIYFFSRPLFSIAFALFNIIALKVGVQALTVKDSILDEGFIYSSMFLSFFSGFGAGKFVDLLENLSNDVVKKIINK